MPEINIANEAGRDAVVAAESVMRPLAVRWLDPEGRQAMSVRFLKSTIDRDVEALVEEHGDLDEVGEQLIAGDPEIDFEMTGTLLRETSRVFVDKKRKIVHKAKHLEVIHNPDGTVREERGRQSLPPNVTGEHPLRWSGKMIKKAEAVKRFVFSTKLQLMHVNGLTYDFLYAMAKELEAADSLLILGAGPKSNQPLILRRGGAPYRGFLEGRTDGDRYALVLHLSNLELKRPVEPKPENDE